MHLYERDNDDKLHPQPPRGAVGGEFMDRKTEIHTTGSDGRRQQTKKRERE